MADFDVAAVALSVPPPLASLTTYRPSITVRNNGIHATLATGTVRIYKNGAIVFSSDVYSATIPAGESRPAQADKYWTPETTGVYVVVGYVTCANDQVEPNNNLSPASVTVGTTPPPPPSPVTLHASQHEEGGLDELSIDGLPGKAKEKQDPFDHASNHQPGGTDELDVTDMRGQLLDPQPPISHGNDAHNPPFTTSAETTATVNAAITTHDSNANAHAAIRATDPPLIVLPFGAPEAGTATKLARTDHAHTGAGSAIRLYGSEIFEQGATSPVVSVKLAHTLSAQTTDRLLTTDGLCVSLSVTGNYLTPPARTSTLSLWLAWFDEVSERATATKLDILFGIAAGDRLFRLDANLSFYVSFAGVMLDALWRVNAHLNGNTQSASTFVRSDPELNLTSAPAVSTLEVWADTNQANSQISYTFGHIIAHGYGALVFPEE